MEDLPKTEPSNPQAMFSTAKIPTADQCVCLSKTRYRPPTILLEKLRLEQDNRCHFRSPGCTGPVEEAAHLCNNPPCRNPKHIVGSCTHCNRVVSNQARPAKTRYAKDSVSVDIPDGRSGGDDPDAISINREKEPAWINYWTKRLNEDGPLFLKRLISEACNEVDISPETDRKYRIKWVTSQSYDGPANFLFEVWRDKTSGKTVVDIRKLRKKPC